MPDIIEWKPDGRGIMRAVSIKRGAARHLAPVRCNGCGTIFDSAAAAVVGRYADCTVFMTPCCNRKVDDRPGGVGGVTVGRDR